MRIKIQIEVQADVHITLEDAYRTPSGYINTILGEKSNHGKRAFCSISSLQGGVMNKATRELSFPSGKAFFYVSSNNRDYMEMLPMVIFKNKRIRNGMNITNVGFADFKVHEDKGKENGFDIVFAYTPILIDRWVDHQRKCATLHDSDYLSLLTEQTKRKLRLSNSLSEEDIATLKLEICGNLDNNKHKHTVVKIHNKINVGSGMVLKIQGCQHVREYLYNIGLGMSTGIGFGAIKIIY